MCRLFGMLGNPGSPADPWLIATDRSLLAQSHASEAAAQRDGWGIAWFLPDGTVHVEKGTGGAFEEAEPFRRAARAARGPLVVGHLRKASNPMRLPRRRLLGRENAQPFAFDAYVFAHNGSIPFPRETRARLGPFESRVVGVNDSEVLFWLLVKHLEAGAEPAPAYAAAVAELKAVWAERGMPAAGPYSGLNVLLARGPSELWAFCHWSGEHGRGLLDTSRPYYALAYAADARQVVVGSEPFDSTRRDWRSLSNGDFLVARADQGLVTVETGRIPVLPSATPRPVG
ncbi:MAG TPA: class II glutamine amidotransferase [Thermoplasmata archaeon]|nr:class II glutamine amidotransferase [Thermoplasmata archaeon]